MILWRISNYADLSGIGGLMTAGRWHSRGRPIVYCASNPSTALLEILVHLEIDAGDRPENFQVLKIEVPATVSRKKISLKKLPANWSNEPAATQAIGDQWLKSGNSAILEVPSALVPETWNMLVNPLHSDVNRLKIAKVYRHPFDTRLFE